MKNKTNMMRNCTLGGAMFGYFALSRYSGNIQLMFLGGIIIIILFYMRESIKNRYPKIQIIASTLSLIMMINLSLFIMARENYYDLKQYLNYFLVAMTLSFLIVLVVAAINYIKISDKKHGLWVKIFLVWFFLSIVVIVILAIIENS